MDLLIPGYGQTDIRHVVFDYNGTIAVNGCILDGVKQGIKKYSSGVDFHVITADTFGCVEKELCDVACTLTRIPQTQEAESKLAVVRGLGSRHVIAVGNGANDRMMLKEAWIGIAVLQEEGLSIASLKAADLVVKNVLDVFGFFQTPGRLVASLRT